MEDREVLEHISRLVEEEHTLYQQTEQHEAAAEAHQRLGELQVALDQCWDLLRQRRARRAAGQDPDRAHVRDASTVEHYRQ